VIALSNLLLPQRRGLGVAPPTRLRVFKSKIPRKSYGYLATFTPVIAANEKVGERAQEVIPKP